jgi:formylglycine-generating enzyme required for sulfatase activity
VKDPIGPAEGNSRVVRGGSWSSVQAYARAASRYRFVPDFRYYYCGFRVVAAPVS